MTRTSGKNRAVRLMTPSKSAWMCCYWTWPRLYWWSGLASGTMQALPHKAEVSHPSHLRYWCTCCSGNIRDLVKREQ